MRPEHPIETFEAVATRYCVWLDGHTQVKATDFQAVAALLAELVAEALTLPDVFEEDSGPKGETESTIPRLSVEGRDFYWQLAEPWSVESPEVMGGILGGDLAEVYHDLKEGLHLYHSGGPSAQIHACWEWRFGFYTHWGAHATSALSAIYLRLQAAD